jgi:ribonuclease HI
MKSPTRAGKPVVHLYTDGACSGNPGPGGWAFILKHPASGKELVRSGAEPETTNNRMELLAVIHGLEQLKRPSCVVLFTDSQYLGKGLTEWLPRWKALGWRRSRGGPVVKNLDLWQRLDALCAQHEIRYHWVEGHSGHEENERCDRLAVQAYQKYL